MSKHRPTEADPHTLAHSDPIDPTPMMLPITRIREYDRNPRRERNPKYDEIKASIRSRKGLDSPLTVTRRPGESDRDYMVHTGGNTRLRILKELFDETQDLGFFEVNCLFIPWVSETEILTAHLIENDTRGDLTFIDRARAVQELRSFLEQDSGQSMSLRQLSRALLERGYRIDASMISRMTYALESLLPAIPKALRCGMGFPQIVRIRQLEKAIEAFLSSRKHSEEIIEETRQWFIQCLARHDSTDWNLKPVKHSVITHLAKRLDEDTAQVRLDLEALLNGAVPNPEVPDSPALLGNKTPSHSSEKYKNPDETTSTRLHLLQSAPPELPFTNKDLKSGDSSVLEKDHQNLSDPIGRDDESIVLGEPSSATDVLDTETRGDGTATSPVHVHTTSSSVSALPSDLNGLRSRMWTLTTRLTQSNGMGECILSIKDGCGFVVDLPESPLYADGARPTKQEFKRVALWWFLSAVAEQWIGEHAGDDTLLRLLPQDAKLHTLIQAMNSDDETQVQSILTTYVSEPTPIETITHHLLPRLDDAEFKALIALIDTRRQLEVLCLDKAKHSLWGL